MDRVGEFLLQSSIAKNARRQGRNVEIQKNRTPNLRRSFGDIEIAKQGNKKKKNE